MSAKLVMVTWVDSRRPNAEWVMLADFVPDGICECVSVGYVIHNRDGVVSLAPNMVDIESDDMQASGIIHIPCMSITKMVYLIEGKETTLADRSKYKC